MGFVEVDHWQGGVAEVSEEEIIPPTVPIWDQLLGMMMMVVMLGVVAEGV